MEEKYLSTFHNMDENDIQIIANQMKEYFGNENEELLNVIAQKLDTHPEIANSFSLHISAFVFITIEQPKLIRNIRV